MDITEEDEPCRYFISWDNQEEAIIFGINTKILEGIIKKAQDPKNQIISQTQKDFLEKDICGNGLGEFETEECSMGFDGIFLNRGTEKGFTKFTVEIPKYDQKYKRDPIAAISGTFTVLTSLLDISRTDFYSEEKQAITFWTRTQPLTLYGGAINGQVSVSMTEWMKSEGNIRLKEIERYFNKESEIFRARIQDGAFFFDLQGACGLNPSNRYDLEKENRGYEFGCHNLDRMDQQLYFLIALAMLCDMFRKSLPPS